MLWVVEWVDNQINTEINIIKHCLAGYQPMLQDLKRRTKHFVETMVAGLPCRVVNGPGPELDSSERRTCWITAVTCRKMHHCKSNAGSSLHNLDNLWLQLDQMWQAAPSSKVHNYSSWRQRTQRTHWKKFWWLFEETHLPGYCPSNCLFGVATSSPSFPAQWWILSFKEHWR